MGIETAILVGLTAVGTGAAIKSASDTQKAFKSQQRAADLARRQQELQAARQRREEIRRMRMSRALAQQSAENQGASLTSSAIGGVGSIVSQAGSNISFLDQYNSLSRQIGAFETKANKAQASASLWDTASNLAFMGAGQSRKIANVFRSPQPQTTG